MKQYKFPLGRCGTATFSFKETGELVLTAVHGGETYALTFLDSILPGHHLYIRKEAANPVSTLCAETEYTVQGNQLMAKTKTEEGITLFNRFTVSDALAAVTMETWATTDRKIYDCGIVVGKIQIALDGFRHLSGGDIPDRFPVIAAPPNYAFKERLTLEGETRYLQIRGGTVWYQSGVIEAHTFSNFFNDDPSWFSEKTPLRTVYAFEEIPPEPALSAVTAENTGGSMLVSGRLQIPYLQEVDGVSFLSAGKMYPIAAMLVRELGSGKMQWLDTRSGWESVDVREQKSGTEFLFLTQAGQLGMRLTAERDPAHDRISWRVEAINTSRDHTVLWCSYPRLYQTEAELYDLFVPGHGGSVETEFNRRACFKVGSYPAGDRKSVV